MRSEDAGVSEERVGLMERKRRITELDNYTRMDIRGRIEVEKWRAGKKRSRRGGKVRF